MPTINAAEVNAFAKANSQLSQQLTNSWLQRDEISDAVAAARGKLQGFHDRMREGKDKELVGAVIEELFRACAKSEVERYGREPMPKEYPAEKKDLASEE